MRTTTSPALGCLPISGETEVSQLELITDERVHHALSGDDVGWTGKQNDAVEDAFWETASYSSKTQVLHHGDCIGADANAHKLAFLTGWDIVVHPPSNSYKRAFVHKSEFWDPERCVLLPEKEYLDRNHDIVAPPVIDLIATPLEYEEKLRSGTWATVRYAKKRLIPVFLVFRDGTTRWERP